MAGEAGGGSGGSGCGGEVVVAPASPGMNVNVASDFWAPCWTSTVYSTSSFQSGPSALIEYVYVLSPATLAWPSPIILLLLSGSMIMIVIACCRVGSTLRTYPEMDIVSPRSYDDSMLIDRGGVVLGSMSDWAKAGLFGRA